MEPNRAKAFGGVGSILAVVGFDLVGYILVLIGLRGLGKYYNDKGIRRNSLWWFIWGILGLIAAIAVFVVALSWMSGFLRMFGTSILANPIAGPFVAPFAPLAGFLTSVIIALIIAEIFGVISAIYLRRAYAALAARTGEGLFNTAAKLYLLGSVLAIVLVGLILIWISWIISAVAFFSMTPRRLGVAAWTAPPPPG